MDDPPPSSLSEASSSDHNMSGVLGSTLPLASMFYCFTVSKMSKYLCINGDLPIAFQRLNSIADAGLEHFLLSKLLGTDMGIRPRLCFHPLDDGLLSTPTARYYLHGVD